MHWKNEGFVAFKGKGTGPGGGLKVNSRNIKTSYATRRLLSCLLTTTSACINAPYICIRPSHTLPRPRGVTSMQAGACLAAWEGLAKKGKPRQPIPCTFQPRPLLTRTPHSHAHYPLHTLLYSRTVHGFLWPSSAATMVRGWSLLIRH